VTAPMRIGLLDSPIRRHDLGCVGMTVAMMGSGKSGWGNESPHEDGKEENIAHTSQRVKCLFRSARFLEFLGTHFEPQD
jgi:hypothetical protein